MITANASAPSPVATPYSVVTGTAQNDQDIILSIWREGGLGQQEGHTDPAYDHARFEWFYLVNPQGIAYVYLLRHAESGRPVGAMGIGPRLFSIAGVPQLGGTLVDRALTPIGVELDPTMQSQIGRLDDRRRPSRIARMHER